MKNLIKCTLFVMGISLLAPALAWPYSDTYCTDGGCSEYEIDCLNEGNVPICLNESKIHAVNICINFDAYTKIMTHHPDACLGECGYTTICSYD